MRAVVITAPGGPEVLAVEERPVPRPAPGEVLVRVRAAALNRADLLQRRGVYPAPPGVPADIPGLEFAGEIVETDAAGGDWRPGERVFGIVGGGAQAEYLRVNAGLLARVPPELDWVAAAATPEAFITAFDALVTLGQLRTGERVLVHAVGSGVGLAAVQVARAVGALPYGTSRTADKVERARALGLADGAALPDGPATLAEQVRAWTAGRGVDVVLDLVGGAYVPAGLAALAERGRLVLVGLVAGRRAEVDLGAVLARRLTLHGTVLRGRSLAEKLAVTRIFSTQVVPLLADGRLRPVVDSTFPMDDVRAAHERLESNETFGKVVLVTKRARRPTGRRRAMAPPASCPAASSRTTGGGGRDGPRGATARRCARGRGWSAGSGRTPPARRAARARRTTARRRRSGCGGPPPTAR